MTEKLVRNTSDPKWRAWWEAVEAAAAKAPTLRYDEGARAPATKPATETSSKDAATTRKAAKRSARSPR